MEKKIVFSGVQPSGDLTIGNYLGAIQYFSKLQDDYDCFFSVVDMHSITVEQVPAELRKSSRDVLALYIATGIDPEKSCLFIQSQVPAHAELTWILSTMTYMGQLNRMTQYKEKLERNEGNQNAGLFTYPILMAADILLYKANFVPVGDDQKQHLELTRDLAERFNNRYSPTFVVPEPMIPDTGNRIMSLQEPESKMSKSDENQNNVIFLLDDEDTIVRKVRRAVTDSVGKVNYSLDQPGLYNLIHIYSAFSGDEPKAIAKEFADANYGTFKDALAQVIIDSLKPIQDRYKEIIDDKAYLEGVMKEGREKANYLAERTLRTVKRKVGYLQE